MGMMFLCYLFFAYLVSICATGFWHWAIYPVMISYGIFHMFKKLF